MDMQKDVFELLLEDWIRTPQPKTINELTRDYLAKQMKAQKGYLPYYRQRRYEKDDIIQFHIKGEDRAARVVQVLRDYYHDTDNFWYDAVDVEFLDWDSFSETKSFIANYQGEELAGPAIRSFEIITERDENDVLPEILAALAKDKRFIAFEDRWLPKELIVDVSDQLSIVENIITENKHPLTTREILDNMRKDDISKGLYNCLEFSLSYFLSKDKNFIRVDDSGLKWGLREYRKEIISNVIEKRHWTITIRPEWLEEGILKVPRGLSNRIDKKDTIHLHYDQIDEKLPYDDNQGLIKGLANYYATKAIAEWDKVHLRLESIDPVKLFLSCQWQRRIDRLLQLKPTDLKWEIISLRDCIIVTLARFKTHAHYREINAEIAQHKNVSFGSVIGTLSRYCPTVFVHAGWGRWGLAGLAKQKISPESEPKESPVITSISDEVWEAVATIEDNDYVYKLLQRTRKPLSFDEICSRLADYLKVDVQGLRATGFLKADDERLRRLDDGTWALEGWFSRDEPKETPIEDNGKEATVREVPSEKVTRSRLFWLLATIVLITFFVTVVYLLIYQFI